MKEAAALVLTAGVMFGGLALYGGAPAYQAPQCSERESIVKFFAIPEPDVVLPSPGWNWPLDERGRSIDADDAPKHEKEAAKPAASIEPEDEQISRREDNHRHMRRRHRRHWR